MIRCRYRLIITLCTVGATLMQALDQTIANVALPYMQGSLSASFDEITWVLTSYITAAAIMTAPVGWLAGAVRPQVSVHHLPDRIHHHLHDVRRGAVAGPDGGVSAAARLFRRRAGAAVAGDDARYLSGRAARHRHGDLGRRRHDRPDPRPDARRLPDRDVQLALRLLHQPAVRHPGDAGTDLLHARARAPITPCGSTGSASPCSAWASAASS